LIQRQLPVARVPATFEKTDKGDPVEIELAIPWKYRLENK